MYKLYGWANTWIQLDQSNEESHIVDTMWDCYKKEDMFEFMVKHRQDNTDRIVVRTYSEDDLLYYVENFKKTEYDKLTNSSCVELKKQIIKKYK